MRVGDYIRTKDGVLGKLRGYNAFNKNECAIIIKTINDIDYSKTIETKVIIKSSPNIIELFEEHDLVVIEYYSLRYEERVTRLFEVTYKDNNNIVLDNAKCRFMLINNDFNGKDKELEPIIKSIVTHEQFKSMEYEVK